MTTTKHNCIDNVDRRLLLANWLTRKQAAERMKKSDKWLNYLIREKRIAVNEQDLIFVDDIDNFEHRSRGRAGQGLHAASTANDADSAPSTKRPLKARRRPGRTVTA